MNSSLPSLPDKASEPPKPASNKGNFALDDDEQENMLTSKAEPVSAFAVEEDDDNSLLPKTVDNDPTKLLDRLGIELVNKCSLPADDSPQRPAPPKVKLDTLKLPSGIQLDPESWGIDLEFVPEVTGSTNFLMDDDDDEPVHLVEMPAELREFMNSETAKDLSPDQLKSIFVEVIQEELKKFSDAQPAPAIPAPPVERVVRETTHERVIERVSGTIEADVPTEARLWKLAACVGVAIPFLAFGEFWLSVLLAFVLSFGWGFYQLFLVARGRTQLIVKKVEQLASPSKGEPVEHWDPELSLRENDRPHNVPSLPPGV